MSQQNTESPKARYWRSLNELRETPEFRSYIEREFPVAASEYPEGVSRRRWIQLMGASLALGGVIGCRYPEENIAPFVIRPEGRVPGEPYSRATNFELAGRVYNLLVSCVDGRPVKIEGNVEHPLGRGGTDVFSQASILGLYDPDRLGEILQFREEKKRPATPEDFAGYLKSMRNRAKANKGRGMAVLIEPTSSPSMVRLLGELQGQLPELTICRFDSVGNDVVAEATQAAVGRRSRTLLDLASAKAILTVEADILGRDRAMVHNSRSFVDGRDPMTGEMSRLYTVEAGFTNTGASADSRLSLRPTDAVRFLAALEVAIDAGERSTDSAEGESNYDELTAQERAERFLAVAAADLVQAGDKAVVVVGEHLGAEAVAAGIRINNKLGSLNSLVRFPELVDAPLKTVDLAAFVEKAQAGKIDSLVVFGANPVFTAPADIDLGDAIGRVADSIYLGEYDDETAVTCKWVAPMAHSLESWGDALSDDGHYGVCQPQILPLLGGQTPLELLAVLVGSEDSGEAIVRKTADAIAGGSLSNRQWRGLLHDGFSGDLKVEIADAEFSGSAEPLTTGGLSAVDEVDPDDVEVLFVPADGIYDGRFANNGWLQEMPQALTKLTWDNAALMSPRTARQLKVRHGTMVALRRGEASIKVPVYEMPGMAHACVVLPCGYGRTRVGAIGGHADWEFDSVGTDVRPLRTSDAMLVAYKIESRPRSHETYELATTQDHWAIDELGRDETEKRSFKLIREGTLALLEKTPGFTEAKGPHVPDLAHATLWKEPIEEIIDQKNEYVPQWGMSVDLSKCTGCNACVIACQSENNVPIVGKEQVSLSREMHWMRLDRYFQGTEDNADVVQEPLMCMHCETAPCEQVCPVAATVHTNEGINAMAYNRCIGTRYCANNCPFKVRRFNYFNFNEDVGVGYGINAYQSNIESANRKLQQLVLNPEVTVRGRGVMEKCTYCIQRVEAGKIQARKEGRMIQDGDVKTACQTACPTRAIEFGNIADATSKVAVARGDIRSYGMLPQLRVKPRTTYMSRIRNVHPRLMTSKQVYDLQHLHEHIHHGHDDHDDHGDDSHSDDPHGAEEHPESVS